MPPPVPIPLSNSSRSISRLEYVLASFEDNARPQQGLHGSSTSLVAGTGSGIPIASSPAGGHSLTNAPSSSHQPRVIRASSSTHDSNTGSAVFGRGHSISPTRHRTSTANILSRSNVPPRTQSNITRSPPPFTPPTYLQSALLSNLIHSGLPPPQAHVPEPVAPPELVSTMSDSEDSSPHLPRPVASARRRHRGASTKEIISWPTFLSIPTQWSDTDKSPHLILSPNGKDVTFNGHFSTLESQSAAAVRAECPIPSACGIYYYEVTVVDRGTKGQISIGFATKDLPLSKLPGWEAGSWGYHGDDGLSFMGQPRAGSEFGPRFATGDTIGCGVNFLDHNAFYTKNGKLIGSVFHDLPDRELYPAIGLRTTNEHVHTNFGESQFKYDIDAHVAQVKLKAWRDVQNNTMVQCRPSQDKQTYQLTSVELPKNDVSSPASRAREEGLSGVMADLVLDYLVFRGYATTARRFKEQVERRATSASSTSAAVQSTALPTSSTGEASMNIDDDDSTSRTFEAMDNRSSIVKAITKGDMETALSQINTYFPRSLTYDNGLIEFKLRCRRFVELILDAYEAKRRLAREADSAVADGAGAGTVAAEGAFAMDLDEEEHTAPQPYAAPTWSVNGSATSAKGKGKQTARRRSSASRPSGRASSRNRTGNGSLIAPISPAASGGNNSEVIEHMQRVLDYGIALSKDWENDERAIVKERLKKTLGLVAYENPYEDDRSKDLVSHEARLELADEVNKAILATTAKTTMPSLERLYRHTGTTTEALGAIEIGLGAFMDVSRILDDRM